MKDYVELVSPDMPSILWHTLRNVYTHALPVGAACVSSQQEILTVNTRSGWKGEGLHDHLVELQDWLWQVQYHNIDFLRGKQERSIARA